MEKKEKLKVIIFCQNFRFERNALVVCLEYLQKRLKINFDDDLMEEDGFMSFYFYVFFFLFQSFSVDYRKLNIFPF